MEYRRGILGKGRGAGPVCVENKASRRGQVPFDDLGCRKAGTTCRRKWLRRACPSLADELAAACRGRSTYEITARAFANGGTTLGVRREDLPGGKDIAAILRYPL